MNDAYLRLIEMARTGSTFQAAQGYMSIYGGTMAEALSVMHNIRNLSNWTRKDVKENEQDGNEHSSAS